MNLRKKSILDTLMRGSDVLQPKWIYFLELEIITSETYSRKWFYLDILCQKDHIHIPEIFNLCNETIIKKVKKTRNPNLTKILYNKMDTGLIVEMDSKNCGNCIED